MVLNSAAFLFVPTRESRGSTPLDRALLKVLSRGGEFPLACPSGQRIRMCGPVMKGGGVEVCPVGPDEGMHFGVDSHLIEKRKVAQRTEELTGEDRAKIYHLFRVVVESHAEGISLHDLN